MTKKQLKLSKEKNDAIVRVAQALGRAYFMGRMKVWGDELSFAEMDAILVKVGEASQGRWFAEARKALNL